MSKEKLPAVLGSCEWIGKVPSPGSCLCEAARWLQCLRGLFAGLSGSGWGLVGKEEVEGRRAGFLQLREAAGFVLTCLSVCLSSQDEDMQIRKRRNLPRAEGQASSTGEPG